MYIVHAQVQLCVVYVCECECVCIYASECVGM